MNNFTATFYLSTTRGKEDLVLVTNKAQKLKFSTEATGGFMDADFVVPFSSLSAEQAYRIFLAKDVVIHDFRGDVVYEGEVLSTKTIGEDVSVSCAGYYAKGASTTAGPSNFAPDATARDIVEFMVDLTPDWQDDFSMLGEDDLVEIGPIDFERADKVNSALEEAIKTGYLDTLNENPRRRPLYMAIWENRVATLYPEPDIRDVEPDWELSKNMFTGNRGFSLELSTKDIYNKIWITYNDNDLDGYTTLSAYEDTNSQLLYGVREGNVNLGTVTQIIAEVTGDLYVKYNAYPIQRATLKITGNPKTPYGMVMPLWKIRAGQLIRIPDLDASVAQLSDGAVGIGSVVGFVAKTSYNNDNYTMTIELGSSVKTLDIMLYRLGVNPGGIS